MSEIVSKIKYAMSLRTPQEEALSYLDAISSHCDYKKDSKDVVEAAASEYCEKQRKVKAEFDFPSFCYAMATGIGKTRLMGASIYYLYKTKGYKHFFILAPGNTIYFHDAFSVAVFHRHQLLYSKRHREHQLGCDLGRLCTVF